MSVHELDDRPAFGGLVGQARQEHGLGQGSFIDPSDREDLVRHPVPVNNGPRLVQQERRAVPGRVDRPPRHGEDIALHQTVHPGDADR